MQLQARNAAKVTEQSDEGSEVCSCGIRVVGDRRQNNDGMVTGVRRGKSARGGGAVRNGRDNEVRKGSSHEVLHASMHRVVVPVYERWPLHGPAPRPLLEDRQRLLRLPPLDVGQQLQRPLAPPRLVIRVPLQHARPAQQCSQEVLLLVLVLV